MSFPITATIRNPSTNYFSNSAFNLAKNVGYNFSFINLFNVIANGAVALYGLKELILDNPRLIKKVEVPSANPTLEKIRRAASYLFGICSRLIEDARARAKYVIHGGFLLASGVMGTAAAFSEIGLIGLGYLVPIFHLGSHLSFLIANVIHLEIHIRMYLDSANLPVHLQKEVQTTAVIGIISNVMYILMTMATILGDWTALAFVFGIIAVSTGCFRILFDFFNPTTPDIGKSKV